MSFFRAIKGQIIGVTDFKNEYTNTDNLPSLFSSLFNTLEIKGLLTKESPEGGLVLSRVRAFNNDIHGLAINIDLIKKVISHKISTDISFNILYLGVLLEAYFTVIRSAYDTLVLPISSFLEAEIAKKLSKEESMNYMMSWIEKSEENAKSFPTELGEILRAYRVTFDNIRNVRDYFIHKGGSSIIFYSEKKYLFSVTNGRGISIAQNVLLGEQAFAPENLGEVKVVGYKDAVIQQDGEKTIYEIESYLRQITIDLLNFSWDIGNFLSGYCNVKYGQPIDLFGVSLTGICIPGFKDFLGPIE